MKYLWLTIFALAAWALVDYLILQNAGPNRVPTVARLRDLGRNVHSTAGWLAIAILGILALRILVQTLMRW
jgi:hypothetical protein